MGVVLIGDNWRIAKGKEIVSDEQAIDNKLWLFLIIDMSNSELYQHQNKTNIYTFMYVAYILEMKSSYVNQDLLFL